MQKRIKQTTANAEKQELHLHEIERLLQGYSADIASIYISYPSSYQCISSHIIANHRISSHIIAYHRTSSHIIAYHRISLHIIAHRVSSCIIAYRSSHIIAYHRILNLTGTRSIPIRSYRSTIKIHQIALYHIPSQCHLSNITGGSIHEASSA